MPAERRGLGSTIDALLAVIPETETELRAALEHERENAKYRAPELAAEGWSRVALVLMDLVGDPRGVEWKREVGRIFAGEAIGA